MEEIRALKTEIQNMKMENIDLKSLIESIEHTKTVIVCLKIKETTQKVILKLMQNLNVIFAVF